MLLTWNSIFALAPPLVILLALLALLRRRLELQRFQRSHAARAMAIEKGSHKARLLHPDIDLSQCIGCGSCVHACPEDGVLDLLHGQAVVVHGARCVGHGKCAEACPTGAIALTFGDLTGRDDLPAITEEFEAVGVPGLFLAGELTGFSLVRTAVSHGTTVAGAVARRVASMGERDSKVEDLLIVGLGPAGLSCGLKAKELGLRFRIVDQAERIGGTVAAYPRRKLVMTQPIQLPLHGTMSQCEYLKEDLVTLWSGLIDEHALPVNLGVQLLEVVREPDGVLCAKTTQGDFRARHVCLCLGRRGTPRRLGVEGEGLSKVQYSLLDADSYRDRRIVVVGGGDSAVEAAIGLSDRQANQVWLCARGSDWSRIKAKNEQRLAKAEQAGHLTVWLRANVARIEPESISVARTVDDRTQTTTIPNDDVFILAGGDPPFALLKRAGVSFDPSKRPTPMTTDNSSTLLASLGALLVCAVAIALWAIAHRDYYDLASMTRTLSEKHAWLRPAAGFGLMAGVLAAGFFAWNLAYLARRSRIGRRWPGSLRFWMATHIFTGLGSFLVVLLHAGFTYRMTVGGFAFVSLAVVLVAGLIGRYFYAMVPHAANGREVELDELRSRLTSMASMWDQSSRGLGPAMRARLDATTSLGRWHPSFFGRVREMAASSLRIRRVLRELERDPAFKEIPASERQELLMMVKRSWRLTMQIAHFEEIRAVMASWRFIHGWLALLMVLFVITHVLVALRYAQLDWPSVGAWVSAGGAR